MLLLIVGLVIFIGIHLVPTQVELRSGLQQRFGANYQIAFALLSVIGFLLIIYGYGKVQGVPGKNAILWYPPLWGRHLLLTLMVPAFVLLGAYVAGLAGIRSRIKDAVGHPMLFAILIWAAGHLLANGTASSLLLFGSFFLWAAYDYVSARKRGATQLAAKAIDGYGGDILAVAIGIGFYAFMLTWGHAHLIGVDIMPR